MNLKDIIPLIDVWDNWKNEYAFYVPNFINEAINKYDWSDWDEGIFYEYFEKSGGQCVSSLQQGYFSNSEKEKIKKNWKYIAQSLKRIAESQNTPLFEVYEHIRSEIFKHTDNKKDAAVNRMIAGLQPKLLSTIVTYKNLNELYSLLDKYGIAEIKDYHEYDWFKASNAVLKAFQRELLNHNAYDLVTYPWQTLDFLKKNDITMLSTLVEKSKVVQLLKYKKQIILQGPPGTGKTKLAKEISRELTRPRAITVQDIKRMVRKGQTIRSVSENIPYMVDSASDNGISLKLDNGSTQTRNYNHVIQAYINLIEKKGLTGGDAYQAAVAKYIYDNWEDETLSKTIQFHPSYSYEDFVRGIASEVKGDRIEYKGVNRMLGQLAKEALENYELSRKDNSGIQIDKWVNETFNDFKDEIEKDVEQKEIEISGNIGIFAVETSCFRYGKEWGTPSRLNFTDLKKLIKSVITGDLKLNQTIISKDLSLHAHYRSTYYMSLLKIFFNKYKFSELTTSTILKNYVLIIDEINRANLSSVFGELIYALEYRGEKVESMYAVDDSTELILPPNLYIIGTMNTADRSIGHIDYAMQRRFAIVNLMPRDLSTELGSSFHKILFDQVSALFSHDTYLSKEFDPKDVQLGHSYFIDNTANGGSMEIRLQHEIKPILMEYAKDGILIGNNIEETIKSLTI